MLYRNITEDTLQMKLNRAINYGNEIQIPDPQDPLREIGFYLSVYDYEIPWNYVTEGLKKSNVVNFIMMKISLNVIKNV